MTRHCHLNDGPEAHQLAVKRRLNEVIMFVSNKLCRFNTYKGRRVLGISDRGLSHYMSMLQQPYCYNSNQNCWSLSAYGINIK